MYLAQPSKCFVLLLYLQSISVKTSWSEIEDNRIIVGTDYKTNKNNKTNVLIVPISKPENDNEQRAQNNNLVFNLLTKSKREKSQESNHTPADSIRKRDYYNYTTLFNNTSYNQYEGIVNVTKTLNNSINFSKIFATPSRDQDGFNKATTENPENKQNNTSTNTKSFGNILSTSNKSKAYDIINSIFDDILLNTDINYIDSVLKPFKSSNQDMCLLSILKQAFMWWSFPNGTLSNPANFDVPTNYTFLDLSAKNYSKDLQLFAKTNKYKIKFRKQKIIAFSAAYNELKAVPYRTLALINDTLKYLTLRGNIFSRIQKLRDESVSSDKSYIPSGINLKNGVAWATFPPLPNLIELDLSNCDIAQVNKDVFKNLSSLRRLYLAHNKMFELAADSFFHVPFINYLDLSFISVVGYRVPYNKPKTATSYIRRIGIYPTTFKNLTNLEYLDLSHTRLFFANIRTFTLHARRLKFLSLCYTNIPIIGNFNSSLIGLDLSGNQYAADFITENTFAGVKHTLKYLFFEKSKIRDLTWLRSLSNLRVLGLAGNNINTLSVDVFRNLPLLQALDLSANHVINWYNRVFEYNEHLSVLIVRDNSINIITTEMLKDFQDLLYLGVGDNDFVCDCLLNDLVETATANNKVAECIRHTLQETSYLAPDSLNGLNTYSLTQINSMDLFVHAVVNRYMPTLRHSYHDLMLFNLAQKRRLLQGFTSSFLRNHKPELSASQHCLELAKEVPIFEKLNKTQPKFQLLDYEDERYWCFNETNRLHFKQLNCQSRNYTPGFKKRVKRTKSILGGIGGLCGLLMLGGLIYLKRWHIHYYYSSLKSAALLSVAAKETVDKFNELSETSPNLVYDVFISYCQNDRQWVLEELLPNVEVAGDVSICMHERDFQIGMTILDNIISCMDRSKALMLIISSNFLLSHWCQFEMHLAQHRIFEASKEHLILVFLEDIPRSKRPKTLQYLMDVKTYIKWPTAKADKQVKPEDKKLFWKRLRKSLQCIGLHTGDYYSN